MVYLIHLIFDNGEYEDYEHIVRVTTTLDKAKTILKEWAKEESESSWIADIEDFDEHYLKDDYFLATAGRYSTSIFIEEKELE